MSTRRSAKPARRPRPSRAAFAAVLLLAAVGPLAAPARANLIVDVGSVTVAPGTRGNGLDVTLTNAGSAAVSIAGFSFGLTTDPAIAFTGADTSVASYIFAGNSLFGPIISTTPPPAGPSLLASDNWATPNAGFGLAAGATVGLGRVLFDASTAGDFPVTFLAFPTTSLSGPSGGDIPIAALRGGVITVDPRAIPEPASVALVGAGLALIAAAGRMASRSSRRRAA